MNLGKVNISIFHCNRLICEVDGDITTNYEYDKNGNVTHIVDNNGREEWYRYDEYGNLVQFGNVEGITEDFKYSEIGKKLDCENYTR